MPSMPVSLIGWKPMQRSSLRGFAKVRVGKSLIISDVAIHASHGKRWAQLPAKPLIDSDGVAKRGDNGKIQYVPMIEWGDRQTAESFSMGVIDAIEREYPGATASESAS